MQARLTPKDLWRELHWSVLLPRRYEKSCRNVFDNVRTIVIFIGYPRSGGTLIGSMLDAHRNILLANELNLFRYVSRGESRDRVFARLIARSERFSQTGAEWMGYSYKIPNQYQGRFEQLMVIGDKKGGRSSKFLRKTGRWDVFDRLQGFGKEIRLIHVIRNPFDNISTRARKGNLRRRAVTRPILEKTVNKHLDDVATVQEVKSRIDIPMIDVRLEDVTRSPESSLQALCTFLGVEHDDQYLRDCATIVKPSAHKSRYKVDWPEDLANRVQAVIDSTEFLAGYNFEN